MDEDGLIWQTRDEMASPTNPLQAIRESYTNKPWDMGEKKFDAWIYGIVAGWDNASYRDLAAKHGWSKESVAYNKLLHENFKKAWKLYMKK